MGDIYRETSSSFYRNNPFQIGAEYFGHVSDRTDINVIKDRTKSNNGPPHYFVIKIFKHCYNPSVLFMASQMGWFQ